MSKVDVPRPQEVIRPVGATLKLLASARSSWQNSSAVGSRIRVPVDAVEPFRRADLNVKST